MSENQTSVTPHLVEQIVSHASIVSFGGGTNSTAMIIEMIRRGEQIDLILFADTGGERPETYVFLSLFSEWVKDRIGIGIEIVRKTYRDGRLDILEQRCMEQRFCPSILYGYKTCSIRYKGLPQDKHVNHFPKAIEVWKSGSKPVKNIGYDAGEPHRGTKKEDKKYFYRHPLIEWGITRDMCVNIIKAEGLPLPGKSSCFFCPNSKRHEILALPSDLKDRAIAMERNAKLTTMKGLGRTWKWEDLIMADRNQMTFDFKGCTVDIPCECYDG